MLIRRITPKLTPDGGTDFNAALIPQSHSVRWRWVALSALILLVLSEISGGVLGLKWLSATSPHLQFLLLCAALAFLSIAFRGGVSLSLRNEKSRPLVVRRGCGLLIPHHSLLIPIVLLALLLRLWHNGDAIRVLVDEMNFLSGMTNFWKPDPIGLLTPMDNISPFTWLFPYWQANFVALFGRNLAALRGVSALVGALNIPALYLLAATLFNRKTALVAAFLLAVFPPHIHYSRIALLSIADPLIGTLALAFLARGLLHGRRLDFALAGIGLGLTQYFFEGGRLLYIPLAAAWLIACQLFLRRLTSSDLTRKKFFAFSGNQQLSTGNSRITHYSLLITLLLTTLLVSFPVYYTLVAVHKPLTGRMDASGLGANFVQQIIASPLEGGLRYLVNHLAPAIRIYALLPDQTRYYGGDTALLLPALVPLFLVGIIVLFRRIRSPGNLLLLLWILAVSFGSSLLQVSAASSRYVVVFPALTLITALGLCEALDWLWNRFRSFRMSTSISAATTPMSLPGNWQLVMGNSLGTLYFVLCTVLALYQIVYYFGPHLATFDANFRETRPNYDIEDAVYRALDYPPGTGVHIISRGKFDVGYGTKFAAFFRDDLPTDGYVSANLNPDILAALPRSVDHLFFFEPLDIETLTLLQSTFKSALEGPFFSPYNVAPERQFVMFTVRRSP